MNRIGVMLVVFVVAACGKSAEDEVREQAARDRARAESEPKEQPKPVKELPPEKEKPPPDPEPTTPAEIDAARKKAMIDGRDKDVIRFCELGKVEAKPDGQVLLGCTLAACRINQGDKAQAWGKVLVTTKDGKPLMEQAIKVCAKNNVTL